MLTVTNLILAPNEIFVFDEWPVGTRSALRMLALEISPPTFVFRNVRRTFILDSFKPSADLGEWTAKLGTILAIMPTIKLIN